MSAQRARCLVLVASAVGSLVVSGCNVILGLDERSLGHLDATATGDGGSGQGSGDGASGACPIDDAGFGDLISSGCWTTFDLASVNASPGFQGAAFDQRYLYFAPNPGSLVARYDTHASFSSSASWTTFDLQVSLHLTPAIFGAVFDGRYVTLVPDGDESTKVILYDTMQSFQSPASWSTFDPTSVNPNANAFAGATFDGQYVYLVPGDDQTVVLRHDPKSALGAWTGFDTAAVHQGVLAGFYGGAFDGRSVYFIPQNDGVVVRYDTSGSFTEKSSWSTFDTTAIIPDGETFQGSTFDGRFLYLAPDENGLVVRYDTTESFTDAHSWTSFDTSMLSSEFGLFEGGAFDGRFVYMNPEGTLGGAPNTLLARYDSQASFSSVASWATFPLSSMMAGSVGGAVFDGQFLYFAPESSAVFARFTARSQPVAVGPPGFGSSY